MTLVLWDIDHTLIETRGVGSELYQAAFEQITGRRMTHQAEVTGRTELAILTETLKLHDLEPSEEYAHKYAEALAGQYQQHAVELRQRGRVLPGAKEALMDLAGWPTVVQTVLTGNLRAVALTKLRVFELDQYIDFEVGAYGDDEEDRIKLVTVAQQRAGDKYHRAFDRENTVLIGDSPSDVETGIKGGARIVGVATGKANAQELWGTGPDMVFNDLMDTAALVRVAVTPIS